MSFTTPSFAATTAVDTGDGEIMTFSDIPIDDSGIQKEDELEVVTELGEESTKSLSGIIPDIDVKQSETKQAVAKNDTKATVCPTYQEAYDRMTALQSKYPEGMKFTNYTPYGNGTEYRWHGGPIGGVNIVAVGCAAFAFELSDAAFGNLPNRALTKFSYKDIKVGDILRVNGNSHVVIVLQVTSGGLIIAEANYNGTVHWGRAMSVSEAERANMLITRYPVGYSEEKNADEETANGNEGNLKWSLTNGGVLTVSGTGAISNYTISGLPSWSVYKDKINTVVIKDGINNIGDYAFYGLSNLLSVYIPNGVKTIGNGAFQNTKLVSVTIPSTVTSIGNNSFYNCTSLTSASVSEGLETIGNYAFRACTSLQYIDLPSSIKSVGDGAFMSSKITSIRFKPGAYNATIGDAAFAQCWYLMEVILPSKLQKISDDMFSSCQLLSSIYIPSSVNDIGMNPFTGTALQSGRGVLSYGGSESDWKNAGGQMILNSSPKMKIEYNVPFDDPFDIETGSGFITKPLEKGKTFKVNNLTYKVTKVSKEAKLISSKSTLAKLTINTVTGPDNVNYKVTSIGKSAMINNKKMTKLIIGTNVKTIEASAFSGCTKLTTVTLGKNVSSIGSNAFKGCIALKKNVLPDSVKTIGASAFYGCKNIKTINIGKTSKSKLTTIGKSAFKGCKKLNRMTIKSTKLKSVGKQAFKSIKSSFKVKVPAKKLKKYRKILKKAGLKEKQIIK